MNEHEITEQGKELIMDSVDKIPASEGVIKRARRMYVTVQHPRAMPCGHRLDMGRQPTHRNCQSCWLAFFQNHGEIVQQCDEMFQADGGQLLIQLQGIKFVRRFLNFMSTIAAWEKAAKEAQER